MYIVWYNSSFYQEVKPRKDHQQLYLSCKFSVIFHVFHYPFHPCNRFPLIQTVPTLCLLFIFVQQSRLSVLGAASYVGTLCCAAWNYVFIRLPVYCLTFWWCRSPVAQFITDNWYFTVSIHAINQVLCSEGFFWQCKGRHFICTVACLLSDYECINWHDFISLVFFFFKF